MLKGEPRELLIAGCGAAYWGASLMQFFPWQDAGLSPSGIDGAAGRLMMPVSLVAIGLLLAHDSLSERRCQKFLAWSALVLGVLSFAVQALGGVWSATLGLVLPGLFSASSVTFWGLNFAALDKRTAERAVFLALLGAFALYFAGCAIDGGRSAQLVAEVLKVLAVAPFALGSYELPVVRRAPTARARRLLVPFTVSRCALGFFVGACLVGSNLVPTAAPFSPAVCVAACAAMAAAAALVLGRGVDAGALLRVAPLAIVALIALPMVGSQPLGSVLIGAAGAVAWFSWIVLSSVQLSDIKERIGWDEERLVFFEKFIVIVAWVLGQNAMEALVGAYAGSHFEALTAASALMAYGAVLMACYLLGDLISVKERGKVAQRALQLSEGRTTDVYARIAGEHGLTAREREVFELLANGFKRPSVCERLGISEGTARTHIDRVYKKVGVHTREELFLLVDEYRREQASCDSEELLRP